ncbi:unnamed protein product, partial [Knipowitschia caucasica]
FDEEGEEELA